MDFSSAINTKMRDVEESSKEQFIVYRDKDSGWHCDHTKNQYGETFDWVEDALAQDPLAAFYTGAEFSKASFPSVYDTVLYNRIRSEYYIDRSSEKDNESLHALVSFFQDNVGELSHEVTDYLTTLERPLAALAYMCPLDMATGVEGWSYNEDLIADAMSSINNAVHDRLNVKANIDGFEDISRIYINDSVIIISENPDAENRYKVAENRYTQYYNETGDNNIYTGYTNDYIEAVLEYAERVQSNVKCVQSRRDLRQHKDGVDYVELKNGDCLPGSENEDFTGKLIIVKARELKPEYRSSENQLVQCTHGNGARPNAKGTSVFGKELLSGESVCFGRHQVAGIADPEKLPKWAITKLSEQKAEKQAPQKHTNPNKKPSLLGKLDDAKAEAAEQNKERNDVPKTKKHGLEV